MPRPRTYPDTVEDCYIISITDLKKWGYLSEGLRSGVLSWSRWGREVASISISSSINDAKASILLSYTRRNRFTGINKDIDTYYQLEKFPSNLGKGFRYYFICPFMNKRCSKLYQAPGGDYFAHRNYYRLLYTRQIESQSERNYFRFISLFKKLEKYEGKYRKSFYGGKPTRSFKNQMKILRKIKKSITLR